MKRAKISLTALAVATAGAGGGLALSQTIQSTATASTAKPAPGTSATIQVVTTKVAGRSEHVLVDARGLPLYTFNLDTSTHSEVGGSLAQLWPPLVSLSPTEKGTNATLKVVPDSNGDQVQYNGHFLYTFLDDTPGQVTGQGVQGFFVATPGVGTTAPAPVAPPVPSATGHLGY